MAPLLEEGHVTSAANMGIGLLPVPGIDAPLPHCYGAVQSGGFGVGFSITGGSLNKSFILCLLEEPSIASTHR